MLALALPAGAQEIVRPTPVGETRVDYPQGAQGDAVVVLEIVVDADGAVRDVTVVSGSPPFSDVALASARRWTFSPAKRDGKPMAARIRFEVRFTEPPPPAPEPSSAPPPVAPEPKRVSVQAPIDVTVEGDKRPPGVTTFTRAEVREIPGSFGDPFRAVEAMPGVTPIISGVPYFFVRGAPPGNVGYFLDGIRVPLLYHVGLGPSVVHPAIVDRVDLYPGGYPARYGRFAGGIVAGEITPPRADFHGEANLRLVDAGALVEAPIANHRGTVLLGGRYSYTGLLLSLLSDGVLDYWDYQARFSYDVTPRDTLSLFSFGAYDFLGEKRPGGEVKTLLSTEFHRVDLSWTHRPTPRTSTKLAVTVGLDRTRGSEDDVFVRDRSVALRSSVRHRQSKTAELQAGSDVTTDTYDVVAPALDPENPEDREAFQRLFPTRTDLATGVWGQVVLRPEPWMTLTPGVRVDLYASDGSAAWAVEPRIAARFEVTPKWRLLHAFGLAHQPPSFVVPVPGFQISGLEAGLQRSVQYSSGVETDLPWDVTASFTLFQNAFFRMTDALGASRGSEGGTEVLEQRSLGSSVGAEVFLKRPLTKKLGGFLSYTLSRSTRSIGREHFPSSFDRTHVLNFALAYDLGRRWRAGTRFVYYTGFPGQDADPDRLRSAHPSRIPAFYRVDARIEKRWRLGQSGYWAAVLEVLNATLSKEVVNVSCDGDRCENEEVGPVTVPSIGVEAVF
ncbi:MAG: TonB family protein [Myxococcales bacterium]|nr:TonB family protein [Myxococcales bacterium]MCB9575765.1 TonB family protein [Polyangiaceae bacterium]